MDQSGTTLTRRRDTGGPEPVDEARELLRRHRADGAGMCAGCLELWHRLAPYPCTQVDWARAVVGRIPSPETLTALGLRELVPFYRGL